MKRPRSPTSLLQGVDLCEKCDSGRKMTSYSSYFAARNRDEEGNNTSNLLNWETKKAVSRRVNRFTMPGQRHASFGILDVLQNREGMGKSNLNGIQTKRWTEQITMTKGRRFSYDTPDDARSTIAISFSQDGRFVASTHGDHSIKIFDTETQRKTAVLTGHPRTPWTVKFNPRNSNIVASGCLGFQVRVWDIAARSTIYLRCFEREIVSLAHHPWLDCLILASGQTVYLVNYGVDHVQSSPIELHVRRKNVRCVGFTPCGTKIIIGEVCPEGSPSSIHRINHRDEVTVGLSLYDFNAQIMMAKEETNLTPDMILANQRLVVPHAILYNDGGISISSCGQFLCCISYQANTETMEQEEDEQEQQQEHEHVGKRTLTIDTSTESNQQQEVGEQQQQQQAEETQSVTPRMASISKRVFSLDLSTPNRRTDRRAAPSSSSSMDNDDEPMESPPKVRRTQQSQTQASGSSSSTTTSSSTSSSLSRHQQSLRPDQIEPLRMQFNTRFGTVPSNRMRQRLRSAFLSQGISATSLISTGNGTTSRTGRVPFVNESREATNTNQDESRESGHCKLAIISLADHDLGTTVNSYQLTGSLAKGITSVKFSPTNEHIVVGYGMRVNQPVFYRPGMIEEHRIAAVFSAFGTIIEKVNVIQSHEDDINIAAFHPNPGYGFVYGTRQGKLRSYGFGRETEIIKEG